MDPSTPVQSQSRSWQWIALNCLTTLLPAAYTVIRTDIITSPYYRGALFWVRLFLGLSMPQLVLFAAVTDLMNAWIIASRINAAAERCHALQPARTLGHVENPDGPGWTQQYAGLRVTEPALRRFTRVILPVKRLWKSLHTSQPDFLELKALNYPCRFERWTINHGFFAVMGGFTVALPRSENDHPSTEDQKPRKTVSFEVSRILQLVERPLNHADARFDLLTGASKARISQVYEAQKWSVLAFLIRLILFAEGMVRRRQQSLAVAPLEVVTVGHAFIAVCITAFWWYKPAYFREGILLSDEELKKEYPGLGAELLAHRQRRPVQYAYTRPPRYGLRPWHRADDNIVLSRESANYRALIVFPLCLCHAAILLLPAWKLRFLSQTELQLWNTSLLYTCSLCGLVTVLALLDSCARLLAQHYAVFRAFWGNEYNDSSHSGHTVKFRDWFNSALYVIVAPALTSLAVVIAVAAASFRRLPEDVLAPTMRPWR